MKRPHKDTDTPRLEREAHRLEARAEQLHHLAQRLEAWHDCGTWWKKPNELPPPLQRARALRAVIQDHLAEVLAIRRELAFRNGDEQPQYESEFMENLRKTAAAAKLEEQREKEQRQNEARESFLGSMAAA